MQGMQELSAGVFVCGQPVEFVQSRFACAGLE